VKATAAALILLGALRHYGWGWVSPDIQRFVWNISGSVVILLLLWTMAYQSQPLRLVVLWWSFEELQVIACSLGRIFRPWFVNPGEAQCSALLGFNLGAIGLALVAILLVKGLHPRKSDSYGNGTGQR
jgi:hypothetical protein